ncbi:MAG: AarF/ABC1/UbiB kinase family protein [Myxococcales bacterium]|nr:AarF/ABC1/UbiB kinase family protein [Myxococcales bacterium]
MSLFRLLGRGLAIGLTVLFHSIFWFGGWVLQLLTLRPKATRQRWQGEQLRCLLRDLGATYVKVGQIMSSRPDIFPAHIVRSLERLQDDVGEFAYRHVERTLESEFGKGPSELFASFDVIPIASASVAQVHAAVLENGTKVAVKIRRPNLERRTHFDLSIMRGCARFLEFIPPLRIYAPYASACEFSLAIEQQIDLTLEADNNRRFRKNFADSKDIILPTLIPALCSEKVLTMTFIEGVKVMRFRETTANPTTLAKTGFHTLLKMIFDDGLVHADLHPGNILITPDNRVALLDLGLTAELTDDYRRVFAEFFGAWASGDGVTMANQMVAFSPDAHVPDYDAFEAEVSEFVARYDGKQLGEVAVSEVVFDMMGIMQRHRVRVNAVFTMVNIAIAVTEGIGRQLDDTLDLLSEAVPFFVELKQSGRL